MGIKDYLHVWGTIFRRPKYLIFSIIVALLFYSMNVLIPNISSLSSLYSSLGLFSTLSLFGKLMIGFGGTIKTSSYISIILITILFGMLFSLLAYKTSAINSIKDKKVGVIASMGLFFGILVPGCAACGVGLLALFGVSAALLTTLPLRGLELSILSIAILALSVGKISKDLLGCKTCKIQLNN